ncbi:ArsR/SmtB family transcription factor [Lacticaseibacillus daqingensis]|uniref:ArsR/SmtB family transcription factor n=1 Tax=Lacticaseibacillus daqingensis TaxID=2486014 RepID=UPI000F77641E|nr:helix-turn-helix transcriptional regulator [Lacticaseibacillus daqingensis]
MNGLPDVTALAKILADPTRAQLIDQLLDGRAHTLLELTRAAGVTPQTGTYHLQRLMAQDIVVQTQSGRHHYFALQSPQVAAAFEALSGLAPQKPVQRLSQKGPAADMAYCRTCYDHLAGTVGVALCESLQRQGWLVVAQHRFAVTEAGRQALAQRLDLDWTVLARQKRQLTVRCLDWSQRRYHLGGAVGHAIFAALLTREAVVRTASRSVAVTAAGRSVLEGLGVAASALVR